MKIKNYLLYCLVLFTAFFVSCKDENAETLLAEGQGEVTFRFYEHTVYTIDDIADVARIKVTIKKDDSKEELVLPTIDVNADGEEMVSEVLRLDVGTYSVVRYIAYNNKGDQIHDMYLPESGDNTFVIKHEEAVAFYFPVNILEVQSADMLKNKLFGLCTEILGPDSTLWPKTWREENDDFKTWENLEFEEDGNHNILYLAGIVFDEKFKGMKKLPANISRFTTLENIMIRDIPEFEELPIELNESNLQSLEIINTSLASLPENLQIKHLYKISIIDSKLTEFPSCLSNHKGLEMVDLVGNEISQIPENAFDNWEKLAQLRIQHTKISSLPANTFTKLYRVYTFDFRWNENLSTLPVDVPQEHTKFQGLLLDGCAFTDIPEAVGKIKELRTLSMAGNKLTSVDFSKLNIGHNELDQVFFDDNKLTSFGKLQSDKIILVSLNNCGLTEIPDLSGMPNLRYLSVAKNNIAAIPAGKFKANTLLSVIDLSENTTLSSVPADFGVYTENKTYKYEYKAGNLVVSDVPVNLTALDLDGCSSLTWTVPASWCCLEGDKMFGGNGIKDLPRYPIVVYNRNANGVTYAQCWNTGYCEKDKNSPDKTNCGHYPNDCSFRRMSNHYQLKFAQDFDEIWAELHKEK